MNRSQKEPVHVSRLDPMQAGPFTREMCRDTECKASIEFDERGTELNLENQRASAKKKHQLHKLHNLMKK